MIYIKIQIFLLRKKVLRFWKHKGNQHRLVKSTRTLHQKVKYRELWEILIRTQAQIYSQ